MPKLINIKKLLEKFHFESYSHMNFFELLSTFVYFYLIVFNINEKNLYNIFYAKKTEKLN